MKFKCELENISNKSTKLVQKAGVYHISVNCLQIVQLVTDYEQVVAALVPMHLFRSIRTTMIMMLYRGTDIFLNLLRKMKLLCKTRAVLFYSHCLNNAACRIPPPGRATDSVK